MHDDKDSLFVFFLEIFIYLIIFCMAVGVIKGVIVDGVKFKELPNHIMNGIYNIIPKKQMTEIKNINELKNYTGFLYVGTNKCPDCREFEKLLNKVGGYSVSKISLVEITYEDNPSEIKEMLKYLDYNDWIPMMLYVEKGKPRFTLNTKAFTNFSNFGEKVNYLKKFFIDTLKNLEN